jgi:ABC-type glycerol-3-phosphate transport system substrate-binding protein
MWPYRPDLAQERADRFNQAYSERVTVESITGDYQVTITGKLQAGQPLDMIYGGVDQLSKWYGFGWLEPLNDLPTLQDYLRDISPKFRDAFVNPSTGDHIALTYYSGWHTYLTNQAILEKAGLENDYPADLDGLYERARKLKAEGHTDTPLQLWWASAFYELPWQWVLDHLIEEVPIFDANFDPIFDVNTETATIIQRWKDAWTEELVPKDSLTTAYADWIGKFASGTIAYMPEQSYQLPTYNDPAQSEFAGKFSLIPNQPGGRKWGWHFNAGYGMVKRNRDALQKRRVHRLISSFGYRDHIGELTVAKDFNLPPSFLVSVFPEVTNDPEVRQPYIEKGTPYRGEEDYQRMLDGFNSAGSPAWWHAPWANDFNVRLTQRIVPAITGETTIASAIEALRADAQELKQQFGT